MRRRVAPIAFGMLAVLLALGCVAFLVVFFVFAFTAALRPGGPDPETDAAGISLLGVFIAGGLAFGSTVLGIMTSGGDHR